MSEMYIIIFIIVTLLFIGFFAGYEIAFVSVNRLTIELKKKQGKSSGIILSNFIEQPAKFIGTCLVGLNFFLVIYGLLFNLIVKDFIGNFLSNHLHMPGNAASFVVNITCTALSTLVVLVFGEFFPKAIFRAKHDVLLSTLAPVANFFHNLFQPFAGFFVGVSEWVLTYLFNVRIADKTNVLSKIDLEHFYMQTKEQDEDSSELNTELFENALSLPTIKIRQCLVPRTEIESIDINDTIADAAQTFITTKLSRLIVYDNSIDNILGYIHQLDLFKKPTAIKDILLPISAVPESMSATDLINKFTKERKSIAWVVDEFGGTAGIITMEDVLEEIFGEIQDEYDTEEFVEQRLAEDEFIFSGRLELDYLNEKYDLEFPENESETLSGYIINQFETIPKQKERIIIDNYQFDVLNVSETRIDTVKMKVLR
jgi:CBS domain containing-hemolysin-like protein